MADISKIKLPGDNTEYTIKDSGAARGSHSHNDTSITWGGTKTSDISPDVMGCIDEFGHNKLAFLPANCIQVHYSSNGGSTWIDYGLTDEQKIAMVTTTGPSISISKIGTPSASTISNWKIRVRIACGYTDKVLKLYTSGKQWLINFSTTGASGCTVTVRDRTIANYLSGTETWTNIGTYNVGGWSGWNEIPAAQFGGNMNTQTSQIGQREFIFGATGISSSTGAFTVMDFRLIGSTNWSCPSELARAGHLYTVDANKNATFPAGVSATTFTENGTTLANKYAPKTHTHTKSQITDFPTLATVATSGSYSDLSNKPTIPTVNNATLTIQKNGTTVKTFTANASSNVTANITVPTKTSDITNDSGFIDSSYHDSSKLNSANITHETWIFTLDDDSTVTKEVALWISQ